MITEGGVNNMNGEELKYYRQRAKLTQERLGLMLGYKQCSAERTVQLWEHDERKIPAKDFRALSKILNIPLDKLVP